RTGENDLAMESGVIEESFVAKGNPVKESRLLRFVIREELGMRENCILFEDDSAEISFAKEICVKEHCAAVECGISEIRLFKRSFLKVGETGKNKLFKIVSVLLAVF